MEQRGSVCLSVTAQRIPLGRSEISRLDFEIPPEAQRGTLSTVEGILICAADELQVLQDERKVQSGTARLAPSSDPLLSIRFYERTRERYTELTFVSWRQRIQSLNLETTDLTTDRLERSLRPRTFHEQTCNIKTKQTPRWPSRALGLEAPCKPEIRKAGSFLHRQPDSNSDSAGIKVPELDLELASGTLGGLVTTVEGLITKISESLERVHGFSLGDSTDNWKRKKWEDFKLRLIKLLSLEEPWTLIIDDPLAGEEYERSWEQNEEPGLNEHFFS